MFPSKQKSIKNLFSIEGVKKVGKAISKFFLFNAIPFNAADSGPYYQSMIDTIAEAVQTSRVPRDTKLEIHIWKRRCKNLRSMIYHSSVDTTNIPKTTDYIFSLMDKVVEEVREENVVQVVTDNEVKLFVDGQGEFGSALTKKAINQSLPKEPILSSDNLDWLDKGLPTNEEGRERDVDSHRKGKASRTISSSSSSDDGDNRGSRRGGGTSGGNRGVGGTSEGYSNIGTRASDSYGYDQSSRPSELYWSIGLSD
ncbi:hypothetical protein AAG906_040522 [Vitis piasezkii]